MKKVKIIDANAKACCSKDIATESKWDYISKGFRHYKPCEYEVIKEHRVRDCMSIKMHCTLEDVLVKLTSWIIWRFNSKYLFFLWYDIIYGWIASYSIREIVKFWRDR